MMNRYACSHGYHGSLLLQCTLDQLFNVLIPIFEYLDEKRIAQWRWCVWCSPHGNLNESVGILIPSTAQVHYGACGLLTVRGGGRRGEGEGKAEEEIGEEEGEEGEGRGRGGGRKGRGGGRKGERRGKEGREGGRKGERRGKEGREGEKEERMKEKKDHQVQLMSTY